MKTIRFALAVVIIALGVLPASPPADAATSPSLTALFGDVPSANGYRYDAHDSAGHSMDTAKIIGNPAGGYLAVYHTGNSVHLATSSDLLNWTFKVTLDTQASQATIQALSTGGFLTAAEYNNQAGSGGQIRLRHYANLAALYAGTYNRERTITRTLSACNEGTPDIISASLSPNIDNSVIELGYHYHASCNVDRQARGTLTNFTSWSAAADTGLDNALIAAAAAQGQSVGGNIGDRDTFTFDNYRYSVHEVQYTKDNFASWRSYLYNWQTGAAAYLPVTTHGGSTAFANPTFTSVTSPAGRPAIVATMFVPSEGAAPGEAGALIYYREFTTTPDPTSGLLGTYYDNQDFTGATLARADATVNFDFGQGAPSPNLGPDQFSVRWTGRVQPAKTETYTFYTQADDGTRLWVNGVQLINDWTDHGVVERSGSIALTAGVKYDIKLEYYDNSSGALARLLWSSPTTPKAVIPTSRLSQPDRGLAATYFAGTNLAVPVHTRLDPNINFNWGSGFGDPNLGRDNFSVRWTGRVKPAFTQTYTFYTNSDDGVRLWVNGVQLVNDWTDHGPLERSGSITLNAGQQYDIKYEYYDKGGGALAQLSWSSASVPKQIISREFLTP